MNAPDLMARGSPIHHRHPIWEVFARIRRNWHEATPMSRQTRDITMTLYTYHRDGSVLSELYLSFDERLFVRCNLVLAGQCRVVVLERTHDIEDGCRLLLGGEDDLFLASML